LTNAARLATALLVAAVATGTASDIPRPRMDRTIGGYHVLQADFHVHMFPLGWSTLAPWDTVIEARYQGLDVIGLVPHNIVWLGKVGRSFSQAVGGPMVITGEEITAPDYHLLAIGISRTISPYLPLIGAIEEVHAQGGVAIAAHPYEDVWPTYDADALRVLDAAEVVRPEAQNNDRAASELREFFGRAQVTAIGNSDYHGLGPMGYSRTYVFARERTERAVLDALREGRTVVYDRDLAYGDPAMIQLAASAGLSRDVPEWPTPGPVRFFSRVATFVALVVVLLFNRWR
jgi:hypothetical protein